METPWAQEIYKKRSKTAEWPFGNIKQNLKVTEFNTTGLKRTQTEAKLLAISHNLKRIYNETIKNELIHQLFQVHLFDKLHHCRYKFCEA